MVRGALGKVAVDRGVRRTLAPGWRWYHFYFLLALFDVVIIVASLALYHRTLTSYEVALRDLGKIEVTQRWMAKLRRAVIDLNAPGNDIFETRETQRERERFDTSRAHLELLLGTSRIDAVDLTAFQTHVERMVAEEHKVFDAFGRAAATSLTSDRGRALLDTATAYMASMDRHQANALQALFGIEQRIQREGADLLAAYGQQLERSADAEKYVMGTVGFVLVGVFWYGRKLQRTHDQMVVDRQRAIEERHARLAAVGEVCSSVAHGIRNPLAAIVSSAQLALEFGTLDETTKLRLRDVLTEGRRLDHRVTRLLDFSRVPEQAFEHYDLRDLVQQAVAEMEPQLHDKDIHVATELDLRRLTVYGDREQIAQSVIEILSNSMDHSPVGSRVRITCKRDADRAGCATVTIADDGPGIPADLQSRVFDLFFTSKAAGNGIGLSFVKRAVELHSGSVCVASANGDGCCIEFRLPLAGAR